MLYDKDKVIDHYDFTKNKGFTLYHKSQPIDYMIIETIEKNYKIEYYKNKLNLCNRFF